MTDLDVHIDVPDDDGLGGPVRVVNGQGLPPWLKALAALLGALVILFVGAYLYGRSQRASEPEPSAPSVELTAPISSATDSPAIGRALDAVEGWQTFANTGDLAVASQYFDPDGPQYAVFRDAVFGDVTFADRTSDADELDFQAQNVVENPGDGVTTVSMDLVVTGPGGQEEYPYDFVYVGDGSRVWTVVDRRADGDVALPPRSDVVDAAARTWSGFTTALAAADGAGLSATVTGASRDLAEAVAEAAAEGGEPPDDLGGLSDVDLFELLVARATEADATTAEEVLATMFDLDQRRALTIGDLESWTQIGPARIVATLAVAGQATATVPFQASAEGWSFDLVAALESSGGATS